MSNFYISVGHKQIMREEPSEHRALMIEKGRLIVISEQELKDLIGEEEYKKLVEDIDWYGCETVRNYENVVEFVDKRHKEKA
jgi:hypothetical protein